MDPDTFTLLPLQLDAQTKALTSPDALLLPDLSSLNTLHRALLTLDTPNSIPPAPIPVRPQRSAQITKLKESGNASFRKSDYPSAIKLYSLAVEMALGRPLWEPSGLVREELAALYANRAQAQMAMREWAEGAVDAELSLECKRVGNPKAWWRWGKCLCEMGRWEEAGEVVGTGIESEAEGVAGDLRVLRREVLGVLEKMEGR